MTGGPALRRIARLRVPLGFTAAGLALWLARPTSASLALGLLIMASGEALRIWASGHIDKGREITTSGPYRYTRHPLYLGSAVLGLGFAVASRSWVVAALVIVYLGLTLFAAIRTEEATLDERFAGAYSRYRGSRLPPSGRRFSLARVWENREHRAVIGFVIAGLLLLVRTR